MMFDLDDLNPLRARSPAIPPPPPAPASSSSTRSGKAEGPSFAKIALDVISNSEAKVGNSLYNSRSSLASNVSITQSIQQFPSGPSTSSPVQQPSVTWVSGYCTILGPRSNNEDRLVALPDLLQDMTDNSVEITTAPSSSYTSNLTPSYHQISPRSVIHRKQGYFAVYDGHCGDAASCYMQRHFHVEVCKHPDFWTNLQLAISETAIRIDQEYVTLVHKKLERNCGTTALGVFIRNSELVVYNIGDCHAVLCRNGNVISLNDAHKPNRADERVRIEAAGGWITEEKELYMGRLHVMDMYVKLHVYLLVL